MTPQVDKLEALLDRVRKNAARPRTSAVSPGPVSPGPVSLGPVSLGPLSAAPASEVHDIQEPAAHLVAVAPTNAEELQEEAAQLSGPPPAEMRTRPQAPGFAPAEPAVVTTTTEHGVEVQAPEEEPLADETFVDEGDLLELEAPEPLEEQPLEGAELEEEAPASSRRVAASMDEALAGAAHRREPPKTIPPESGAEPRSGAELELARSRAPQGPTPEQLGETIHLEEGPRAEFELDEPLSEPLSARPSEESVLEAEIPSGIGAYHHDLAPPPEAREELERVRLGEVRAEVVQRPVISTNVVEFVHAQERPAAETFGAWLDASLELGA